jgi:hypothetical protein
MHLLNRKEGYPPAPHGSFEQVGGVKKHRFWLSNTGCNCAAERLNGRARQSAAARQIAAEFGRATVATAGAVVATAGEGKQALCVCVCVCVQLPGVCVCACVCVCVFVRLPGVEPRCTF